MTDAPTQPLVSCQFDQIARWASERGRVLPGVLGAYSSALAGEVNSGTAAAYAIATALNLEPDAMMEQVVAADSRLAYSASKPYHRWEQIIQQLLPCPASCDC